MDTRNTHIPVHERRNEVAGSGRHGHQESLHHSHEGHSHSHGSAQGHSHGPDSAHQRDETADDRK